MTFLRWLINGFLHLFANATRGSAVCLQAMVYCAFRCNVFVFHLGRVYGVLRTVNAFIFASGNSFFNITRVILEGAYCFQARDD